MINSQNQSYILYLSTYPPRKCGIATFTRDLSTTIDKITNPKVKSKIIALNDNGNSHNYNDRALYQINDIDAEDYVKVAQRINENDKIKLISVQHEFKIFGSDYGGNLLLFLEEVKKPVITTFHTVLPYPSEHRKKIIQSIAEKSSCLVVMSTVAVEILKRDYGLKNSEIIVIPHGVPDVNYESNVKIKKQLGFAGKMILTSFGLLRPGRGERSSGKGCEYVLDSLSDIAKKFPNVLYLIIGVTHPKTLKVEGEKYRNFLENKVKDLNLEKNVSFINRYLTLKEIIEFLQASDVYISSTNNPNQIVSGTLSYAMSCGRAVVSTPTLYAKEAVNKSRGILVDFEDSKSFADAIIKILSNPRLKEDMGRNSYEYTRDMVWGKVATAYNDLFENYLD